MRARILILEEDPQLRGELELALAAEGHEIARADEAAAALRARRAGARQAERDASRRPIVAASAPMIALLEAVERLASRDAPVLLRGEPGSGRESIARVLHAQSARRRAPFVAVDGADGSAGEPGAERFGVPGDADAGGPIGVAEGGTLFVDGVDALPHPQQRALLRAVRDREMERPGTGKTRPVDLRLVATTREPLASGVATGALEPALAQELDKASLRVPALRERREDLPLLVDHFLARAARALGRPAPRVGADALARLVAHTWPGNLRELEAVLLCCALRAAAGTLSVRELPHEVARGAGREGDEGLALKPARKAFEADWIRRALAAAGGNRTRAARLLEISHRALLYKLKEFGITD